MSHRNLLLHLSGPKRAYHRKSRTGCITCKARKIRCDEQKPECDRCASTGRKCDGYTSAQTGNTRGTDIPITTLSSSPITNSSNASSSIFRSSELSNAVPHNPRKELKLALSRSNLDEFRSYRYFLEVSAPSLAGVFHDDFWLGEIPRACEADPAIWHAIVSLGAAYEAYATSENIERQATFALKQFNTSIKCLIEASSRREDKWRALTVSVIFTCICSIQGLHREARMHLTAGCKLLHELEEDITKTNNMSKSSIGPLSPSQGRALASNTSPSIPVSLGPVRAILINFDTQARAMDNGGLSQEMKLIADNDSFNNWRMYSAPCRLSDIPVSSSSSTVHPIVHATRGNLLRANRAAESLLSGMIIFSQIHAGMVGEVLTSGKVDNLEILISRQEPFIRCFSQLSIALSIFRVEMDMAPSCKSHKIPTDLTKALLTLTLFHSTIRLLLVRDPEVPDQILRAQGFPAHYRSIVDMVERILKLEMSKAASFMPTPSIGSPLSLVALIGSPNSTRRRALELMRRYPRREGLWDTSFTVKLVETVMAHEQSLLRQMNGDSGVQAAIDTRGTGTNGETEKDMTIPPLLQMYSMRISFEAQRRATVTLTTWQEWLTEKQVQSILLTW